MKSGIDCGFQEQGVLMLRLCVYAVRASVFFYIRECDSVNVIGIVEEGYSFRPAFLSVEISYGGGCCLRV